MKKPIANWRIISWVVATLCAILVILWASMPQLLVSTFAKAVREKGADLLAITVEKINPWAVSLSDLEIHTQEGNLSLKKMDVRYDPVSLSNGKVHALSLTSPDLVIDSAKFIDWVNTIEKNGGTAKTAQDHAEQLLSNPPVQHLRLRDATISTLSDTKIIQSELSAEGDFHKGLAQLRMDGNFSGLPWLGDLTMIQEGTDLFLGATLQFPDLSRVSQIVSSLNTILKDENFHEFNNWAQIEQGAAKGQWTGRVEQDGIMDQFIDFNVSNLILQCRGITLNIPQAILFVTPRTPQWIDSNFYANLNWGENLDVQGLKISAHMQDDHPMISVWLQCLRTRGVLPNAEVIGLGIDDLEFAFGEEGEFLGFSHATLRFSALHLQEGLFNLYDGELSLEWLGEDRFHIKLIKANGSFPSIGLNLYNLCYDGEVAINSLPKLTTKQTITIEEAFLGEDQKIENLQVEFNLDSMERIEFSCIHMRFNDLELSLDPANFVVEMSESPVGGVNLSFMEGELHFTDFKDFSVKHMIGNIKLNSLDPLESNGTQSIRFDLHAGEQVLQEGEIRFELLSTGEKIIETVKLCAFDGLVALEKTKISESFEDLELRALTKGLNSQKLISLFEDLDAEMDGNLSGALSIRKDLLTGWDFYGGALTLDSSESAKLHLNTKGMLTEGLEPGSTEHQNMYLLERALQDLHLDAMNIIFKVMEDGNRVVEMNVRGESELDGKTIKVEYRPKIIGGLDALIQQADLSKWGITP